MKKNFIVQALKYGVVGVMNTLITAFTIWILMHFVFGIKGDMTASTVAVSVSNTIGYIVGVINSFLWNRSWTFKSEKNWMSDLWKFTAAFLICFLSQLVLVNLLNTYVNLTSLQFTLFGKEFPVSFAYICQLIGIVFYSVMNFLCNKYYTFKK
jgi:Predicted membrane protein